MLAVHAVVQNAVARAGLAWSLATIVTVTIVMDVPNSLYPSCAPSGS